MQHKKKGSNAERELLFMFFDIGFMAARVAGSGSSTLPTPDIIVIKDNIGFAIECKTKSGEYLNIREEQIKELETWEKISGHKAYIAWRLTGKKWYFVHFSKLNKTKKAFSIKKEEIIQKGLIFNDFIKQKKEDR
ncbi:hypothetical protein GW835_02890 [archaeon]|nr:hypothetical protein [archaeon]NCP79486.1 hypothetical protein [archaeon]NCP97429.1 hypothetical protein [archaeon]NCQ07253.1 hypothetical protein [archaeon]NCT58491.1 hypothetical protein [archaeon]